MQTQLIIPAPIREQISTNFSFNKFIDRLYQKTWIVDCAKPSPDFKKTLSYLSRYIKQSPIAESKLREYYGSSVIFSYLDHTTKTFRNFTLTIEQFIARFIQHIPDKNVRMIRYYGFLSNRTRGKLLPIVYKLLNQEKLNQKSLPGFVELMQKNFGFNPLKCILCGHQLVLSSIRFGKDITELLSLYREVALLKNC